MSGYTLPKSEKEREMLLKWKCPVCPRTFHAYRFEQKYCSVACKQKAYRDRKKK